LHFTLFRRDDEHTSIFKRFSVQYNSDSLMKLGDLDAEAVTLSLSNVYTGEEQLGPDCLKFLLPALNRSVPFKTLLQQGHLQDDKIYKAWAEDRASLAFGFANWVILLWDARWTSPPCSCGIRFETLPGSIRQHTFTTDDRHACDMKSDSQQRLLLLGLVLAEITLATPLRVNPSGRLQARNLVDSIRGRQILFDYKLEKWEGGQQGGQWKAISRSALLREVKAKSFSESFTEAVQYCLDNRSVAFTEDFKPGHIVQLCDNVVEP
jgi:hypothetical protein